MQFREFDWDQSKRYSNIEKHGIDFAAVPPYVVYTIRGETCRLISARRANERERRKYQESIPQDGDC